MRKGCFILQGAGRTLMGAAMVASPPVSCVQLTAFINTNNKNNNALQLSASAQRALQCENMKVRLNKQTKGCDNWKKTKQISF